MHAGQAETTEVRSRSTIFVTHDVEEAVILRNCIIVMNPRPGRDQEGAAGGTGSPMRSAMPDIAAQIRELKGLIN